MEKITIAMSLRKSTKGTHVYGNENSAVQTVYVRKDALPPTPPQNIVLTIEEREES